MKIGYAPVLLAVATLPKMASAQTTAPTPAPDHPCLLDLPESTPTCWDSLDKIWCSEWVLPQDFSVKRTYYLCPKEEGYTIGNPPTSQDPKDDYIDGERNIFLQPNVEIICGEEGSPSNDCVIQGGLFHVQSYYGVELGDNLIQGITFKNAIFFNVFVSILASQNIKFKDCVFTENTNRNVIFIQGDGDNAMALTYMFEDTIFENNAGVEGSFGMIVMNHLPSSLVFNRVIVRDNNYAVDTSNLGFAINTLGPLVMTDVCFQNNVFKTLAPIIGISGTTNSFSNVYGTPDATLVCKFAYDFEADLCFGDFDADFCFDSPPEPSISSSPTVTASAMPTASPPTTPTATLTASPTVETSKMPTASPTSGSSRSSIVLSTLSLVALLGLI